MNCPVDFLNNISLKDVQKVLFITLVLAIIFKPSLVKPYQTQIILFLIILCMISSNTVEGVEIKDDEIEDDEIVDDEKEEGDEGDDENEGGDENEDGDEFDGDENEGGDVKEGGDESEKSNTTIDPCPEHASCIIHKGKDGWDDKGTMCYNPTATPPVCVENSNCEIKNIFKQCKAPKGSGPGSGSKIPTTPQYGKRTITVNNNCNKSLQLVSTLDDSGFMRDNEKKACNDGYGHGVVQGGGKGTNCKNIKLYRTPVILSGQTVNFDESLYMAENVDSNYGSGGCTESTYCRPGVNYQPAYPPSGVSGVSDGDLLKYQGKIEFTFGGFGDTGDSYDASAMLTEGCGAHVNPWENDLGYSDDNEFCKISKRTDGKQSPVSHNKKELKDAMKENKPSDKYKNYKSILDELKGKNLLSPQNKGCLTEGGFESGDCLSGEGYVCGYPLYYNYPTQPTPGEVSIEYQLQKNEDKLQFYKQGDSDEVIYSKPVNEDINNKIITSMRNELYKCTRDQSDGKAAPNQKDKPLSKFIPFKINVSQENQCNNDNENLPQAGSPYCAISGEGDDAAQTCPGGYMFNYDDATAGNVCNMVGSKLSNTPGYTITFCPDETKAYNNLD